jgi:cell division transport system ATP-binding protein
MIALEGVTRRYGRHREVLALDDLSLAVGEGDCVLLTGPSGAGKTTLLRLLFAAETPDSGRVTLFGRDIGRLRRSSIPYLRRNIGVVFQDFKLLSDRSAIDNVGIALEIRALPKRFIRAKAADALAAVGLSWKMDVSPAQLSAGEQQRVAIARALVGEPALLLADEPTGNLDPDLTQDLLMLFSDLHRRGTTLVLATHDLSVMAHGVRAGWRREALLRGRLAPTVEARSPAGESDTAPNVVPFPPRTSTLTRGA